MIFLRNQYVIFWVFLRNSPSLTMLDDETNFDNQLSQQCNILDFRYTMWQCVQCDMVHISSKECDSVWQCLLWILNNPVAHKIGRWENLCPYPEHFLWWEIRRTYLNNILINGLVQIISGAILLLSLRVARLGDFLPRIGENALGEKDFRLEVGGNIWVNLIRTIYYFINKISFLGRYLI